MKKLGHVYYRPVTNHGRTTTIGVINGVMSIMLPDVEIIKDSVAPDLQPYELYIVDSADLRGQISEEFIYDIVTNEVGRYCDIPLRKHHKRILSTTNTWLKPDIMDLELVEELLFNWNYKNPITYILFEEYNGNITFTYFPEYISQELVFSLFNSHIT